MKEVPNKQFTEKDSTVSLLTTCLNNPGDNGLDLAAIRARSRVMDALEEIESGGMIKLEDADYTVAQQSVKSVRWAAPHKHFISFAEQFGL